MKPLCYVAIALLLLNACSPARHNTSTSQQITAAANDTSADGSSFEKAIVINEKSESAGVNAEYAWIKAHYPGAGTKMQSLTYHDKKPYDVLTIKTADGSEKKIYFDISGFFGKW